MSSFVFFIFSIASLSLTIKASEPSSSATNCIHGGPLIKFPFHLQTQKPNQTENPNFHLFCEENNTVLHFPSYGNLLVKSISYETLKLNLFTPKTCVHEVFLNLNLSLTPFLQYFYRVKSYKYLNCSSKNMIPPSFSEVPCLSGEEHHVFVVEPEVDFPDLSCRLVKTVSIPFKYSPYLDDKQFGLALTWNLRGCIDCEEVGMNRFQIGPYFKAQHQVIIVSLLALMVMAILVVKKIGDLNKEEACVNNTEQRRSSREVEESLGEYKPIKIQFYDS